MKGTENPCILHPAIKLEAAIFWAIYMSMYKPARRQHTEDSYLYC
jgi:hypothetical protein